MEMIAVLGAFAALSQEHRLAIFRLLLEHHPEGLVAGAVAERLGVAPATLSFHLKELSAAGLIAAQPNGRFIRYRANVETMNGLIAFMTENCCMRGNACPSECAPQVSPKRPLGTRQRVKP